MLKLDVDDTWVKASLHCHSRASDGMLEPADVADYYFSRGYGVVALTDHDKITTGYGEGREGIVLPSVEISKGGTKLGADYHIVAIGIDDPSVIHLPSPSDVIDYVNAAGGVAVVAHPYWSGLVYEDFLALDGYIGIEIYNTGCDVEVAKGYSTVHWDSLISSAVKAWGLAVDDAHRYHLPPVDADGGWVKIKAGDCNAEEILNSLRRGSFYSSTGPSIGKLEMSESFAHVEVTPVARVNLVSRNSTGLSVDVGQLLRVIDMWPKLSGWKYLGTELESLETEENNGLTKVFLKGKDLTAEVIYDGEGLRLLDIKAEFDYQYMRLEAVDQHGKTAWSNPVFLKQENSILTDPKAGLL